MQHIYQGGLKTTKSKPARNTLRTIRPAGTQRVGNHTMHVSMGAAVWSSQAQGWYKELLRPTAPLGGPENRDLEGLSYSEGGVPLKADCGTYSHTYYMMCISAGSYSSVLQVYKRAAEFFLTPSDARNKMRYYIKHLQDTETLLPVKLHQHKEYQNAPAGPHAHLSVL